MDELTQELRRKSRELFPPPQRDGHAYHSTADLLDRAASTIEALSERIAVLEKALGPFIRAGQRGVAVAEAVRAANLAKAGLTPLMCPEIPAGVHAAESIVSFADWKAAAALTPDLSQ